MTSQHGLPTGYALGRPTAAIEDELVSLVTTCDIADVGVTDIDVDDIREWFESPGTSADRDGWIVRDTDDRLVAWAYIESWYRERTETACVYLHPEVSVAELVAPLTDLLVRRSAERAAEDGQPDKVLEFYLTSSDVDLAAELTRRGSAAGKTLAQMRRVLDGTEGQVAAPAAVTVKHGVDPADDDAMRAFHDVVGRAFGTASTTPYDAWRSHLAAAPTTPYDEWLTAEADGRLVAVMQAVDMSGENMGWIRNLGVLPDYQGRGIARAMIDTAMATSYRKGRTLAGLGVNVANASALGLYKSVGMTVTFEVRAWPLIVPACP